MASLHSSNHAKSSSQLFKAPYHILFKKFFSLILLLLSFLIPLLNSPLVRSASRAPSAVPVSFDGRSILCFVIGIFGSMIMPERRTFSSALRAAFATLRRTFFDFAREDLISKTGILYRRREKVK